MKIFRTIAERNAHFLLILALALGVAVSGSSLLQNGSSRMASTTVVKGGDSTATTADSLGLTDSDAGHTAAMVAGTPARERVASKTPAEKTVRSENGRALGSGEASYYGHEFEGRSTASGEAFDPAALTAAHRTLPFGSKVRVTNAHNGRSVVVRINDRGPFVEDRLIDVSSGAAKHLGMVQSGTARVMLELL